MREAIFLMGLPGAGKSTVLKQRFAGRTDIRAKLVWIDPDQHKGRHPFYLPERAFEVHGWSNEQAEMEFQHTLLTPESEDVLLIVDGTGTHADTMVRRMNQAKAAGFTVKLLYVKVSLATSLRRVAGRERKVPEVVVRQKARDIAQSYELVSPFADVIEVVNND